MKYRLATILFIFFSWLVKAQTPHYTNFTIDNGLASNEVYDVMEDSNGFMWFATDQGVSKYNGYEFKNFTVKDGLPNNTIFGLYESNKGKIWLRSYEGALAYIKNDKVFTILPKKNFNYIRSLYVDRADTVWISDEISQYKIYPDENELYTIKRLAIGSNVRKIDNHKNGVLVMSFSKSLKDKLIVNDDSINLSQDYLSHFLGGYMMVNGYNVSENEIWLDFGSAVLSIIGDSIKILKQFEASNVSLHITHDEEVFVASSKGVYLLDEYFNIKRMFLSDITVTKVLKDREGGYWFCTTSKGVFYTSNLAVSNIILNSNANINGIEKLNNQLFAVSLQADIFTKKDNKYEKIFTNTQRTEQYIDVHSKNNNEIIFRTNKGFVKLDQDNHVTSGTTYLPYYFSNNKEVGLGLNYVQTEVFDSASKITTPKRFNSSQILLSGDSIFIPTTQGLYRFDLKNGLYNYGIKFSQLAQRINAVGIDHFNRIWIGTNERGIYLLDKNKITHLNASNSGIGEICRNLIVDDKYVWATTEKGLLKIRLDDPAEVRFYTTENGLLSHGVNCLYSDGDTLFLGHAGGVTKFSKNYEMKPVTPKIQIDQIWIKNSLKPLQKSYEIAYNEAQLKIAYTGISYGSKLTYKYRLKGEKETLWDYTTERSVEFLSIPPGKYVFEVVAVNSAGIPSSGDVSVELTIVPPVWERWWFLGLAGFFLLVTIIGLFKYRVAKIHHKIALERKLMEVEQQALRARMNPHFIFNSLNSIQTFILKNDKRNANKYLSEFAKLMRSILENSDQRLIPITRELETLKTYVDIELLRFKGKFLFEIILDESIDFEGLKIPPLLIQPYIENAIWHGIMHKKAKGIISVQIKPEQNGLLCIIEDDGIGRKQSQKLKLGKQNSHEPKGLQITANRIEILKLMHGMDFSVDFIDKEDNGIATGTCVCIRLPFLR